nr:hypothetical protein [Tanacetum cinerariifolium]
GMGIELLFDAALLEDAQLKKTPRKSKRETYKLQASGSNDDGGNDDDSVNDDGDDVNEIASLMNTLTVPPPPPPVNPSSHLTTIP